MALLNAENYDELNKVSSSGAKRQPGKFFSVFITGGVREAQEMGKFQCMTAIEGGDYLIQNAKSVYFIPYFVKKFWEKTVTTKSRDGKDYSKLVAFGWDDDIPKIDDSCKYAYVIAGVALNSDTKKALLHQKDLPDSEIKKGDPVMIHFKCSGVKVGNAVTLMSEIDKKAKLLPPLSNSPEFEKKIVYPRRFIVTANVGIAQTEHGNKNVFSFNPEIQLPDKAVEQVMNSAKSLTPEFEKQFDKTAQMKSGGVSQTSNTESSKSDNPVFETSADKQENNKSEVTPVEDKSFDLGI